MNIALRYGHKMKYLHAMLCTPCRPVLRRHSRYHLSSLTDINLDSSAADNHLVPDFIQPLLTVTLTIPAISNSPYTPPPSPSKQTKQIDPRPHLFRPPPHPHNPKTSPPPPHRLTLHKAHRLHALLRALDSGTRMGERADI